MKLFGRLRGRRRFGSPNPVSSAHHTDISTGLAQAVNASRLVVPNSASSYMGACLAETAGAVAKVRIHDGIGNTLATGSKGILATITFAASGSMDSFNSQQAVEVLSGAVYLEVVSGSVEGCIYWA